MSLQFLPWINVCEHRQLQTFHKLQKAMDEAGLYTTSGTDEPLLLEITHLLVMQRVGTFH